MGPNNEDVVSKYRIFSKLLLSIINMVCKVVPLKIPGENSWKDFRSKYKGPETTKGETGSDLNILPMETLELLQYSREYSVTRETQH